MSSRSIGEVRELTVRVIVLGLILSVVMGAANVYLGLKAGMTVSASIPAAVIAMLILRGVMKNGTVLEANQVQTAASAGESLAAGIIFTMPAMILIGAWSEFDFVTTTVIAFTGGLLGILFMIPMRRVFVVSEESDLPFPEGVACAAVLQAGEGDEEGGEGISRSAALGVVFGALVGAVFKLGSSFVGIFKHTLEGATAIGSRVAYLGADISPALVAVGFIVRLNVALLIFIGGGLAWLVCLPLLDPGDVSAPLDAAWGIWSTKVRYIGVGAMVVGGLAAIFKVRMGLVQAVMELRKRASMTKDAIKGPLTDQDIPGSAILGLGAMAILMILAVYASLTSSWTVALIATVIMVIMAFFFTAVASYIVGLVGNSNSPVSGMTITAVLFTGLMLYLMGFTGQEGMVATLGVAAIVCCTACTSGDVCNDLKTGQIVGATPYRQQIMQVIGVAAAALVMAPVLQLLHSNTPGGIGGKELAAPQAQLFASLAKGFFGDGTLPWGLVGVGAGVGVVVLIIDAALERKGSTFRAHLMPIAVGMYLPFGLAPPILIGGMLAHVYLKHAQSEEEADKKAQRGVLYASGVIAGESLMGVGLALLASAGVSHLDLSLGDAIVTGVTAVAFIAFIIEFARRTRPEDDVVG